MASGINFIEIQGVALAQKDGLVMAVVRRGIYLDAALDILSHEMSRHRIDEPGVSGELVLDPLFAEEMNLPRWAHDNDLANRRISFHLPEQKKVPLEQVAQERFDRYLSALHWAREVLKGYTGA